MMNSDGVQARWKTVFESMVADFAADLARLNFLGYTKVIYVESDGSSGRLVRVKDAIVVVAVDRELAPVVLEFAREESADGLPYPSKYARVECESPDALREYLATRGCALIPEMALPIQSEITIRCTRV